MVQNIITSTEGQPRINKYLCIGLVPSVHNLKALAEGIAIGICIAIVEIFLFLRLVGAV